MGSVHSAWHPDVGENQIYGMFVQNFDCLDGICGFQYRIAGGCQTFRDHEADGLFIFDHEY